MLVSLVCYFLLFSRVLAFNVTIYKSGDYNNHQNAEPVRIVEETFKFEFNMNEILIMDIRLKNKAPDVIARVYVTYKKPTNDLPGYTEKKSMRNKCNNEHCLTIKSKKFNSISISIQLEKENVACASQIILEGKATTKKDTDGSLCQSSCAVVMDVQNECQDTMTTQQPESASSSTSFSLTNILIYVMLSVIVICVIILGIYISVKKIRLRNSDRAETMELKTYSTNEVLYADLSFVNGNSQPPKQEEESPYAEIIGVLKPK